MSDASRRRAVRSADQTGATEDHARVLRERVRAGELSDAQLRLAAVLGVRGAAEALGLEPVRLPSTHDELRGWAEHLARLGTRARALAVGGLYEALRRAWCDSADSTDAASLVTDPEVALLDALCRHAVDERAVSLDDVDGLAAQVAALGHPDDGPGAAVLAARAVRSRRAFDAFVEEVAGEALGDARVIVDAIVAAALPWALGEAPPARPTPPAPAARARPRVARPYSPSARYAPGDRVVHARFGEGTVVSVDRRRMVVRFGAERRQLVHGG
jgi:hypothetical protein